MVSGTVHEVAGSGSVSGSHTYATGGDYTTSVRVCDKDNGCAVDALLVHVSNSTLEIPADID